MKNGTTRGIALALSAFVFLSSCGRDKDRPNPLPTVNPPPETVLCRPYDKVGPVREFQVSRVEKNPFFCYVCGECFYRCPR